jgi:hypothetical protein
MKFEDVLPALRAGQKARRCSQYLYSLPIYIKDARIIIEGEEKSEHDAFEGKEGFNSDDILAEDWEVI